MTRLEELNEITNSIINGQRIQALEQLTHSCITMNELFEYLALNDLSKEIPILFRIAQNKNIIKVKGENY